MARLGPNITIGSIGPSATPTVGYSNLFAVIQSPWGVDNQVITCSSFADFVTNFGGLYHIASVAADGTDDTFTTVTTDTVVQGYYAIKGYFDEKGNNPNGVAHIVRVVKSSSGATAGVRTFSDGGANNTTITAKWKGLHGNCVQVKIEASEKGSSFKRFTLDHPKSGIREVWHIDVAATAADVSKKSQLATIALPAGGQLPSNVTSFQKLNGGTPGTADSYNAADADIQGSTASTPYTGLQAFNDSRYGTGFVCIPGKYSANATTYITAHAAAYYRMGLLGSGSSLTQTSVVTDLVTTRSNPRNNHCTYYWPQIWVSNENSDTGGNLLVDPVGHIAGLGARMDAEYGGPHKSPAGLQHPLRTAIDVERNSAGVELTNDAGSQTLADSQINTLRIKPGGVVVYGLRTIASDLRYLQINTARVVELVYLTVFKIMEPYTFEPIDPDGKTFAKVTADLELFMHNLRRDGVLFGDYPGQDPKPTDAYRVTCGFSNNTPYTMAAGELRADVSFAPTPNIESSRINLLVAAPGFNAAPR